MSNCNLFSRFVLAFHVPNNNFCIQHINLPCVNNDFEKLIIMLFPYLNRVTEDQRQAPISETENSSWSVVGNVGLVLSVSALTDYMVGKGKQGQKT